jgi:hypothetical protein
VKWSFVHGINRENAQGYGNKPGINRTQKGGLFSAKINPTQPMAESTLRREDTAWYQLDQYCSQSAITRVECRLDDHFSYTNA